ncbi:2032_t:CDS:1, partial [Gigaspora rosea]
NSVKNLVSILNDDLNETECDSLVIVHYIQEISKLSDLKNRVEKIVMNTMNSTYGFIKVANLSNCNKSQRKFNVV